MRCRFPWCTIAHKFAGETGHSRTVARFANLTVLACLLERPDPEPDEAYVRMVYPTRGRKRDHDVTPTAAADWSEMLAAIDVRDLAAISQALYRAGRMLGASK